MTDWRTEATDGWLERAISAGQTQAEHRGVLGQ